MEQPDIQIQSTLRFHEKIIIDGRVMPDDLLDVLHGLEDEYDFHLSNAPQSLLDILAKYDVMTSAGSRTTTAIPGANVEAFRKAVEAALEQVKDKMPARVGRTYRHLKRGTSYRVVGEALLQISTEQLKDGDSVTVYQGEDGKLFVRGTDEFHDGRFEEVVKS